MFPVSTDCPSFFLHFRVLECLFIEASGSNGSNKTQISTLVSTPRFTYIYMNGHVFVWYDFSIGYSDCSDSVVLFVLIFYL